jgi:predicted PurR-regulated permease PerM
MTQSAEPPRKTRVRTSALAVSSIVGILLCLLIAWPFLGAITWALTLAILFLPFHARVEKLVKQPNIAALLSTSIVVVAVVVPAVFVIERLISEAASGIQILQTRVESGELQKLLASHPAIAPVGSWIDRRVDLPSMMASIATWLSSIGAIFVKVPCFRRQKFSSPSICCFTSCAIGRRHER